jgi:hypothetical protein
MGCYDEVRLQFVIGILGIFHVKSLKKKIYIYIYIYIGVFRRSGYNRSTNR